MVAKMRYKVNLTPKFMLRVKKRDGLNMSYELIDVIFHFKPCARYVRLMPRGTAFWLHEKVLSCIRVHNSNDLKGLHSYMP